MKTNFNKSIAIIGGGFTGIIAAKELTKLGFKVTIFEANNQLGGLASGCHILGNPIEKSPHVVLKNDEYLFKLLEELKIKHKLNFFKSSISTYYDNKLYPMMNPIDLLKFSPLKFHNRIKAGLIVLYLQKVKNWKKLSSDTALSWLYKYAGDQVTKVMWEPLLKGKFGNYFDKVTMEFLWGRIKSRVDCRDAKSNSEILCYLEGGWEVLIKKILQYLEKSNLCKINLNSIVSKIENDENEDKVKLTVNEQIFFFDSVLLTVPSNVASRLLDGKSLKLKTFLSNLEKIKYLDAAVMLFATKKPVSKYFWHNINIDNSPFVVLQTITNLIGNKNFNNNHVHYIVDYISRDHKYMKCTDQELISIWTNALQKLFPNFDSKSIIESKVLRVKNAQHIVDMGYEEKIPSYKTPLKNVYLCNFSQLYPMDRGINYSIRDGYKMAKLISSDLNLDILK